jgi:plasmid maintenance system antidote protein VapI
MNKILKAKIVERYGSQVEFAKKIGEHEAIVSRVIRGHHELTTEERLKWAIALGCSNSEILFQQKNR